MSCEHLLAVENYIVKQIRNSFPGAPAVSAPSYTLNGNYLDYKCDTYGGEVIIFRYQS